MARLFPRFPTVDPRAGWLVLAALSLVAAGWAAPGWASGLLIADAAALATVALRRWPRHDRIASLKGGPDDPLLLSLAHRLVPAHPVSGLPLREALLARMSAERTGTFGAIAFADFDRLTAFDPALGERVFAAATDRLRAMLPADRMVAQVDRGKVGLWFPAGTVEQAQAELEAIGYALGQTIDIDGTRIVPEIKLRVAAYDDADDLGASGLIARTLASFAVIHASAAAPAHHAAEADLARERYALEQDLRHAIARNELRLAFQPLVDAGHGCVSGAEALIRWDHAELGPVSPARFIPIVEAMGLASEIGSWALNAALREAREWHARGLGHLRVAVNVSGLQLERDDLPILVQRTLQRHELPARALEIELTESVATNDARHCRRIFEQLRAMGVALAVDDFGTGYSGFSSLRTLAFDKIKIDREFVTDVDTRRDSQAICQSIVALGRGLGIRVLAEGVERHAEYAWLRRHGCQHFQGYYFAAPLTRNAFVAFAHDKTALAGQLRLGMSAGGIEERLSA